MRKIATLTVAALMWGSASFATGYGDVIVQAFESAGYTNVGVVKARSAWLVTASMNGQVMQFTVDPSTGRSSRSGDDGPLHDIGDDHGHHSAGHHSSSHHSSSHHSSGHHSSGHHSSGHDSGDDHGGDRGGRDDRGGDDHGHHSAGHD